MQEKIGNLSPPEIQLFDHKIPPNSWIKENLEAYHWLQAETESLSKLLSYMQALQAQEQPPKAAGKPLELQEELIPLPSGGSAAEISNTALFNLAQSYVKMQLEFLESMFTQISQTNPELARSAAQALTQLKQQIASSFPNLSEEQIKGLNHSQELLHQLINKAPLSMQRSFWNQQLLLLRSLLLENGENMRFFHNETKEMGARIKLLQTVEGLTKSLQDLLASSKINEKQFMELVQKLQDLANKNGLLQPGQTQALVGYFQQLATFKSATGTPLYQLAADFLIQSKLKTFLKKNPEASPAEIKAFLRDFLKNSHLQDSGLPFMQELGSAIEKVVNNRDFPHCKGNVGLEFDDKLVPKLLSGYLPEEKSVELQSAQSEKLSARLKQGLQGQTFQLEGYKTVTSQLSYLQDLLNKASLHAVGQRMGAGVPPGAAAPGDSNNLPNEFSNAIINHYMPQQEKYLMDLAMVLYLDNEGAMFGNTIMKAMLGFQGAADTYDLNQWLHNAGKYDGHDMFSGETAEQAENQLKAEIRAIQHAMSQIKTAEDDISGEISGIKKQLKNPKLPASQKSILQAQLKSLENILSNLMAIYNPEEGGAGSGQLPKLLSLLQSIKFVACQPKGKKGEYFYVESSTGHELPINWQSDLSTYEGNVVDGQTGSNGQITGGLTNVYSQAQTFQQTYSDLGQNQQMMLQMRLTEIQQEWTVVTTALGQMNQEYMAIIRNIYR